LKKLLALLATLTPGIFLIGYNIGTGSITTMVSAGADYGMSLVLPVLLSCIFTYFLIITFGRFTIVTGKTALQSFRLYFGTPIAFLLLIALLASEWISCAGVMAIVVQVVQEWSRPLTSSGSGFNPIVLAILFGAFIYWIFWQGRHQFFEKILAFFVTIMGLSFLMTMFMVVPSPQEIMKGLVPFIPTEGSGILLLAGMVGTTMGGILYVVRSILVQEKGWQIKDLKLEKRDATVSAFLMFALSIAVMACAAGTLYPQGLHVDNAIDMVRLLEPLAGRFAISIFVGGIVCAGVSSIFPIVLLAPWLLADYRSKPRNLHSTESKLLVLFGVLLGLVVPVFGGRPVFVLIFSQAATLLATPLIVGLMWVLYNRRSLLGKYCFTRMQNLMMGAIFLFTLTLTVLGAYQMIFS
jgi:Mn2+/Fe2+ NRAMP family transporter